MYSVCCNICMGGVVELARGRSCWREDMYYGIATTFTPAAIAEIPLNVNCFTYTVLISRLAISSAT
jgi:hypothetical protein